jgi:hypothetical protein
MVIRRKFGRNKHGYGVREAPPPPKWGGALNSRHMDCHCTTDGNRSIKIQHFVPFNLNREDEIQ